MEKEIILKNLKNIVLARMDEAMSEIESIQLSKANETKSSAGDKYETGMAMLQIEEQKANVQLSKARELLKTISMIDTTISHSEIELGSYVETSNGHYFLSIGLGQINIDGQDVFVLSMGSPVGAMMKGKKIGDTFSFQGKTIDVLDVR